MFVKSIKIAKRAMFPIFRWEQKGVSAQIGVAGTGFFINSNGYFISVAHVFDGRNQNTKFLFFGCLPGQLQNPRIEIREIARDDEHDIFLGKIELKTQNYFHLSIRIPEEGRSICVGGYPLAQISKNSQGGLELGGVRRYFQPSFVLDIAGANVDNGQGLIRKHDGFLVRDVGLFGMSGGPVFNKKGIVVGMQGSVTQPRISQHSSGRTISVENAQVIKSELMVKLLRDNKIKFNFLGKF